MNEKVEELQKELDNCNSQLNELNLNISNLKNKDDEGNKDKLLEEQKKLEEDIALKTKTLNELKGSIDPISADKQATYRLIAGSTMEEKLKEAGKTDTEIAEFAEKIDGVVRKFLDKELEGFSNKIKNPVCVGIQFAMMEALTAQGASSASFFNTFGEIDVSSGVNAMEGFLKSFTKGAGGLLGGLDKGNKFFELARRVQNIVQFMKFKKNLFCQENQSIPELMNAYKFKELLNNAVRNDYQNIYKETTSELLHFTTDGVTITPEEEQKLKDIANNPDMKINEKTIASIEKALGTADKFLDKRSDYSDSATGLFDKIKEILDINVPFFGPLSGLIGINWPADLLGKNRKKKRGVLDFVLNIFGISGGVEGLHMKYVMEHYDTLLTGDQKGVIKNAYKNYQDKVGTEVIQTNDEANSTRKLFESKFSSVKEEKKTLIKQKIPPQYGLLKESVVMLLGGENVILSPVIVNQFAKNIIVDGKVDATMIQDKEAFADKYLQYMIPYLVSLGDNFINSPQLTGPNVFALTLLGALVGEKYFVESINLGLVSSRDFEDINTQQIITPENGSENINGSEKISALTFPQAKAFAYAIFGHGPATDLLITLSKDNPAMIVRTITLANHEGRLNFGMRNHDPSTVKDQTNIGTFQISDSTLNAVQKKYDETLVEGKRLWGGQDIDATKPNATAQKDLGSWLGYISLQRGGQATFDKLADPKLTDSELIELMHTTIQVGDEAIGESVVKQIATETTWTYLKRSDFRDDTERGSKVEIKAKTLQELAGFGDSTMGGLKIGGLGKDVNGKDLNNVKFLDGFTTKNLNIWLNKPENAADKERLQQSVSCLISTGYNDIANNRLNETAASLEALISALQPTQVVLCTLVHVENVGRISVAGVDKFNQIVKSVAARKNCPLIDFHKKFEGKTLDFQEDGMHLNSYKNFVGEIEKVVTQPKE